MPTKETRATKRAKVTQIRNARRTAATKRRAYRLIARYERRIEAKNDAIKAAIDRRKTLIQEWRDTVRNARQEMLEAVDAGSEPTDDAVDGPVEGDRGGGEDGRVLPSASEAGGDGGSEAGAVVPGEPSTGSSISSVVGY